MEKTVKGRIAHIKYLYRTCKKNRVDFCNDFFKMPAEPVFYFFFKSTTIFFALMPFGHHKQLFLYHLPPDKLITYEIQRIMSFSISPPASADTP